MIKSLFDDFFKSSVPLANRCKITRIRYLEKLRIYIKNKLSRDALYMAFLYVFSFAMTTTQYFFAGYPYPVGYDTVNNLVDMFNVDRYGIAKTIFPFSLALERLLIHPGYILMAHVIHVLFGLSYFTIEKFLPSLLSAFLPILFYKIVFVYTNNRPSAIICGFIGAIYYGRLRLTLDLHKSLLAFLLFSVVILILISKFKDEKFWKDLSSKPRKEKMLSFFRFLKTKSSLLILFLLFYAAYAHIELFILFSFILLAAVIMLVLRVYLSAHEKICVHMLWFVALLALMVLPVLFFLGNSVFTYMKWLLHRVTSLPPEEYIPPTLNNLLFNFSFGVSDSVVPVTVGAYKFMVPTLFSFPYDLVLISFCTYLGLMIIFRRIVGSQNPFEAGTSCILFSWLMVPFLMSFACYFGLYLYHLRVIIIAPIPMAASIGLNYVIKHIDLLQLPARFHVRIKVFARILKLNLLKVLGISLILLLLLNSTLLSFNFFATRGSYIHPETAGQLKWLRENYPPDKIPIFIVDMKEGYLINIAVIELFMGDFYKGSYDVDDHPKGAYLGKIAYFIEEEYTPYEGRIYDGTIWGGGYVSRRAYSNYSLSLLKEKLGPDLSKYDVFLLTGSDRERSYVFDVYERSMVSEIHEGIFMLNRSLFRSKYTISACDSASGWNITHGIGSIRSDVIEKKEGTASINLNFSEGHQYSSNYVYGVQYEVPEISRGKFLKAEFLQLNVKLDDITFFDRIRVSLVDASSNYRCWDLPARERLFPYYRTHILSTSWNILFIPLNSEPTYTTPTLNMSDINYVSIEVWYSTNGAQTFWLDNISLRGSQD